MKYLLTIFVLLTSFKIQAESDNIVGKEFFINKPIIYISGIEHCREHSQYRYTQEICIQNKNANTLIFEPVSAFYCYACLNGNTDLKFNSRLKVISEYQKKMPFTYRSFGKVSNFLLLEDELGNRIELSKSMFNLII